MRVCFDIIDEPKDGSYRALLDFCASYCKEGILVVREKDWLDQKAKNILTTLTPFIVSRDMKRQWPGTTLATGLNAEVIVFRLCAESLSSLKHTADGLYDWQQPQRPEDLTFIRANKEPMLVSIAHENDAYIVLESNELDEFTMLLPGLRLKISAYQ